MIKIKFFDIDKTGENIDWIRSVRLLKEGKEEEYEKKAKEEYRLFKRDKK